MDNIQNNTSLAAETSQQIDNSIKAEPVINTDVSATTGANIDPSSTIDTSITPTVPTPTSTSPIISTPELDKSVDANDPAPFAFDATISDSDKATLSKSEKETTDNDFYDAFIAKQMNTDTVQDLQSADTYWKNRPEERKEYEAKFGDKARDAFDQNYAKIEASWRDEIAKNQDKVSLNERYDWMFGKDDNKDYNTSPTFADIHAITTGEKRIGDMLTDKSITDIDAALRSKTYMNDKSGLVKLGDNEKWWYWSKGPGTIMNGDDPRHRSSDGREIVGYEEVPFGPEYRGDRYVKAIYSGDKPKGNVISVWDTTSSWILGGLKGDTLRRSALGTTAQAILKTPINSAIELMTSAASLANSIVVLTDKDDKNALSDWLNNQVTILKSAKIGSAEYDKTHQYTVNNAIDMVANLVAMLYSGKSIMQGTNKLMSLFFVKNPLLMEAKALEKAGDVINAGKKYIEFDAKYGKVSSMAGLFGMGLLTGSSIIDESRRAGFSEKETALTYSTYLIAMLGANTINLKMLEPFLTHGAGEGVMTNLVKKYAVKFPGASAETKLAGAKSMLAEAADMLRELPAKAAQSTATSEVALKATTAAAGGLNAAFGGAAMWFGQATVENAATLLSHYRHGDNSPKFDNILEDGYTARQLPILAMNALGGFVGGSISHFMPGMAHDNPQSFLVKGDDDAKLVKIALLGGETEKLFFKAKDKAKKSGRMGSDLLSVKMNEKTGDYYKMTDPEAAGTLSHAEATDRAISYQYAVYKTLYGDGTHTFDDLAKQSAGAGDQSIVQQIRSQTGHVFHQEITNLHNERRRIITELVKDPNQPLPGNTKTSKTVKAKTEKENTTAAVEDIKNPIVNKSVLTSPIEDPKTEADNAAKYKVTFDKDVLEKAELIGTKNYAEVKKLVDIDRKIDDILSGSAAAEQLAKAIVLNKNIQAFIPSQQANVFSKQVDAKGNPIDNKLLSFGDELLKQVFQSDINLAKLHANNHADYVKAATIISDALKKEFTSTTLDDLFNTAIKTPHSLAIDPSTSQISTVDEGVNNIIDKLIPEETTNAIILAARENFGLWDKDKNEPKTTEELVNELEPIYNDFINKNRAAIEDEAQTLVDEGNRINTEYLPDTYIKEFVEQPGILEHLQKMAISKYIDILEENKIELFSASINRDLSKFKEEILDSTSREPIITTEPVHGASEKQVAREKKLKLELQKKQSELEFWRKANPTTLKEIFTVQTNINKLTAEVSKLTSDHNSSKLGTVSSSLPLAMENLGPKVLIDIAMKSRGEELEPIVGTKSSAIDNVRSVISKYDTVLSNISPVVPIIQKQGAALNLLNELGIDPDTGITSGINKIIDDGVEEDTVMQLPNGRVVYIAKPPSIIKQLQDSIIRKGTSLEEFRDLEKAKTVMDTVKIRMGQVDLLAELDDKLHILQKYTREHIPTGSTRYDTIPKFLSEHIYDPERWEMLNNKTIRSDEEKAEFEEMGRRRILLYDSANPYSLKARLTVAQEELQALIDLGVKSQSAEARSARHKIEVANHYNNMKSSLVKSKQSFKNDKSFLDAVDNFTSITEQYSDSNTNDIIKGKEALDKVFAEAYLLPEESKQNFLKYTGSYLGGSDSLYYTSFLINAMATNNAKFEKYYSEALVELKDRGITTFPTLDQENMIRSAYSFGTDDTNVFKMVHVPGGKTFGNMFAIDGIYGAGKTTMIGYALNAIQKHLNARYKSILGDKYKEGDHTSILFAADQQRQANKIATECKVLGVTDAHSKLDKLGLYKQFESFSPEDWDSIGMIAFDEASWIQGFDPENVDTKSELEYFYDKLETINANRAIRGILPLKFLGIGDAKQGGWQEGLPTVFDDNYSKFEVEHDKLGKKRNFMNADPVLRSRRLDYAFRTLCNKITETTGILSDISDNYESKQTLGNLGWSKNQARNKIVASWGVVDNDVQGRFGGVNVVKSIEELYNDNNLINNIKNQIDIDNKLSENQRKFKVLIVDDNIKGVDINTFTDNMAEQYGKSLPILQVIKDNPKYFEFNTVRGCQGNESMYVLSNLIDVFPDLPIVNVASAYNVGRAATVINRARLYAKIAVAPTVNMESANNSIVKMLPVEDANKFNDEWNDFYLTQYRNIGEAAKSDVSKEPEALTKDETQKPKEEVRQESGDSIPPVTKQEIIDNTNDPAEKKTVDQPTKVDAKIELEQEVIPFKVDTDDVTIINNPEVITDETKIEQNLDTDRNTKVIVSAIVDEKPTRAAKQIQEYIDKDENTGTKIELHADVDNSDAKNTMSKLSDLGFLAGYLKIDNKHTVDDQPKQQAYYASDLFGSHIYKNFKNKDKLADGIKDEANALRAAMLKMKRSGKGFSIDGYSFSLVSTQVFDTKSKSDQIVHLIYAKSTSHPDIKFPVLMIPYDKLPATDAVVKTLQPIRDLIEHTSDQMETMSKAKDTQHLFGSRMVEIFGDSTKPLDAKKIAENFAAVGISQDRFTFPELPANTTISRVAMSDASGYEKTETYPSGYYSTVNNKVSEKRSRIGLLFTETIIDKPNEIFSGLTSGQPDINSEESKKNYVAFLSDKEPEGQAAPKKSLIVNDYPLNKYAKETTLTNNVVTENIKGTNYFTIASVKALETTRNNGALIPTPGLKRPIFNVKDNDNSYNVILFKTNTRIIPVRFSDVSNKRFELFFGFDANGKPIDADKSVSDMEAKLLLEKLNKTKLSVEDIRTMHDIYSESVDINTMRKIIADAANYKLSVLDSSPVGVSARLEYASKQFVENKLRTFEEHRLSLGEFRELMKDKKIQLSKAITLKTGTHSGKSLVLYTRRGVEDINLQDPEVLIRLSNYLKKVDFDQVTPESFDIAAYTKEGVGVLLLDSKFTTPDQLLSDTRVMNRQDIIRATSPLKSVTNTRMIGLLKELADISHTAKYSKNLNDESTHTRFKTLGTENGKPLVTIFSPETKIKLIKMFQENSGNLDYDNLSEYLWTITSDAGMGRMIVNSKDTPDVISELFSIRKSSERQDRYEALLANDTDGKYAAVFAQYGFPEKLNDFMVKGSFITDKDSKTRIVDNNNKYPIAYVPSSITKAGTDSGSFDMVYLHQRMLDIYKDDAHGVAKLLGQLMTYSEPNTLRKGVPWTGGLQQSINKDLAFLDDAQANMQLETSAKGIGLPIVMLNSKGIVDMLTKYYGKEQTKVVEPNSPTKSTDQIITDFVKNVDNFTTNELNKITDAATNDDITDAMNNVAQYIREQKSLHNMESLTTIGNEKKVKFESDLKNKMPKEVIEKNSKVAEYVKDIKDTTQDMMPADAAKVYTDELNKINSGTIDMDKEEALKTLRNLASNSISLKLDADGYYKDVLSAIDTALNKHIADPKTRSISDLVKTSFGVTYPPDDLETSQRLDYMFNTIDKLNLSASDKEAIADLFPRFKENSGLTQAELDKFMELNERIQTHIKSQPEVRRDNVEIDKISKLIESWSNPCKK